MKSIKIDDILFAHAKYSTDYQESKYIDWNRNFITGNEDIAVYTDGSLSKVNNRVKYKVGWLLESPAVSTFQHKWIKRNYKVFDIVFTNNRDLLEMDDKFQFVPTGGCWIKPEDQQVYPKSKTISIIASNKNWTDGHAMRQVVIKELGEKIDVYGSGHNPIDYKLDGLKDYMFSIVVENTKKDYYFTEKLIDCFMTGTIPIYWGCPSIGNYFDSGGMFSFDNIGDLHNILNRLEKNLYDSMFKNIKKNLEMAKEYLIAEDYMFEKYLIHKII